MLVHCKCAAVETHEKWCVRYGTHTAGSIFSHPVGAVGNVKLREEVGLSGSKPSNDGAFQFWTNGRLAIVRPIKNAVIDLRTVLV